MNDRDRYYIEDRLLAPAVPASEAITRMVERGVDPELVERLSMAIRQFNDACRTVRHDLFMPRSPVDSTHQAALDRLAGRGNVVSTDPTLDFRRMT